MGSSKAMYLGCMTEMRTTNKGMGLFVPDGHVVGEWVLLGPFVGTLMATSRVKEKEKEYTLMATAHARWWMELLRTTSQLRASKDQRAKPFGGRKLLSRMLRSR